MTRSPSRCAARLGAFAGTVGLVLVIAGTAGSVARHAPEVVVFGDSLMFEARAVVRRGLAPVPVGVHAEPGAAPCDFLSEERAELHRTRPRLVVLETAGSNIARCMRGARAGRALVRRYVRDVGRFIDAARSAHVAVLVFDPPPIGGLTARGEPALDNLFRRLREHFSGRVGVTFSGQARAAVSEHGRFVSRLPCLPEERSRAECSGGTIPVRDGYFGVHLCPKTYANEAAVRRGCGVYSSGALRYGRAVASAIRHAVGIRAARDRGQPPHS